MTRPFQRGDIVRHRANGMVGRVAAAYTLGDGCFLEVRDSRGSTTTPTPSSAPSSACWPASR